MPDFPVDITVSPSIVLQLPGDADLLQAAGAVALAHGQLELTLRMTVKTLAVISIREALNATADLKNWELRDKIKRLFKQKTRDEALKTRMDAILGNCARLSGQRNGLIHRTWALNMDGSVVVKGDDHGWGPPPSAKDLKELAAEISDQVATLNNARLRGFIHEVASAASS